MKLFRTTAQLLPPALVGDRQGPPQHAVCVFIEALNYRLAEHAVQQALSLFWHAPVQQIAVEQAWSEDQLLNFFPTGGPSTGDARLFELPGDQAGGLVLYARPERTYFFVQPSTLERLLAAQQRAAELADWKVPAQRGAGMRSLLVGWGTPR